MKIKRLLLSAALAIPVLAFADDKTAKTDTTKTENATLSNDEVKIVAHLHHVNLMEVDMGKQAKLKGTAAVKRYGEMLVTDHSKADKDLLALTKKRGLVKIPAAKPETEAEKAEMKQTMEAMAALKKLKGADFDREYLRMMVEGHETELAKSDVFIASASDADLKMMLEGRKASLQKHAGAARELQNGNAQASVGPSSPGKATK